MTRAFAAAALLWACALTSPARAASPPPSAAAKSFDEGRAAFERGDYRAAGAAFDEAARIEASPIALVNGGAAWERAGEFARAAEDYDRALLLEDPDGRPRAMANERIAALEHEGKIATLLVIGPRTVAVRLDGASVGVPGKARAGPGHHRLEVTDLATERTTEREVDLRPGEIRRYDVTPAPARVPSPAPEPGPSPAPAAPPPAKEVPTAAPSLAPVWISFGVAGAAAIFTGVFALRTLGARDEFNLDPSTTTRDAFYRERTIANVGAIVAGGAAATGLVLWLVLPSAAGRNAARSPKAGLSPSGAWAIVGF
jgi:tetratricopeptide (TPR) repeat protein